MRGGGGGEPPARPCSGRCSRAPGLWGTEQLSVVAARLVTIGVRGTDAQGEPRLVLVMQGQGRRRRVRSRRARPVSCQQKHPSVCGRHAARFGQRTGSGGAGAPGVTGLTASGPWSHALSGQWTGLLEGTAGSRAGRAWKSLERPAGREREGKEQRQDHGGHRGTGLQPTEAGQSRSGRIGSQLRRTSPSANPHARR